jgi:prepilin-type N-terminal cleavage/methylation domain-containing protein
MSSPRGFTLIEVLMVLTIATIAISIVAPNLLRTYGKIQAQSEIKMLTETLKNVGLTAFLSQSPQSVVLSDAQMVILPSRNVVHFSRLVFPENVRIDFNIKGLPNQNQVAVQAGDRIQEISFKTHIDF